MALNAKITIVRYMIYLIIDLLLKVLHKKFLETFKSDEALEIDYHWRNAWIKHSELIKKMKSSKSTSFELVK